MGAANADPNAVSNAGHAFVIFGSASGFYASLEISDLDGQDGFRLQAGEAAASAGAPVHAAGDVDGDGFDDIIIGAPEVSGGASPAGEAFLYLAATQALSHKPARTQRIA